MRELTRRYSSEWDAYEAQHLGMSRANTPTQVAFLHIPKAGGMGMRKWLFECAAAAGIRSFVPCYNQLSCYAYFGDLPLSAHAKYGLVAGHMPYGFGELTLVLLRDPAQRMVSLFHWLQGVGADHMDFDHFESKWTPIPPKKTKTIVL